jgi:hypothetical protein
VKSRDYSPPHSPSSKRSEANLRRGAWLEFQHANVNVPEMPCFSAVFVYVHVSERGQRPVGRF